MSNKPHSVFGLAVLAILIAVPSIADGETVAAGVRSGARSGVGGQVLSQSNPLQSARVYAYQLADLELHRVTTDSEGGFLFSDLPVGLYKVIAHKSGFLPTVVLLTRSAADAFQYVEVHLKAENPRVRGSDNDFWSARADVPPDVLRDIAIAVLEESMDETVPSLASRQARFEGEIEALTGVDRVAAGESQVTGGHLDMEGKLGEVHIGLRGGYRQLAATSGYRDLPAMAAEGQTSTLELDLDRRGQTQVSVASFSSRLESGLSSPAPVDFEHYRLSVSQAAGERARARFSAQFTSENGFHRRGFMDPIGVPEASETLRLEGSYSTSVGEDSSFETGLRYRENRYSFAGDSPSSLFGDPARERVDIFGRGGLKIQPTMVVEYGLYTTLRDGSLSLAPRGGLVVQLSDAWQASTVVSHRLETDGDRLRDFSPTLYNRSEGCDQGEESCYKVFFSRTLEDESELSFGAIHREFSETLRLYFDEDFFDRYESVFLVPGDRLPEVHFAMQRQIAQRISTRLESNLAAGGGGVFYAGDRAPYENEVRYLVTSLDTQFQRSSTGVFIAFHRLEQELNVMDGAAPLAASAPEPVAFNRLQLMLTQDLNGVLDLATHLAVQLNMELTQGSSPFESFGGRDSDELRKRFLGGIAVRF